MILRYMLLIGVAALLAACGAAQTGAISPPAAPTEAPAEGADATTPPTAAPAPEAGDAAAALEGTTWTLETLEGKAVVAGSEVTLTLDPSESRANGKAGCNSYFATYTVNGDQLTFEGVGATKMFCQEPAGVMEQEQRFAEALEAAQRFTIAGDRLTIVTGVGDLVFVAS